MSVAKGAAKNATRALPWLFVVCLLPWAFWGPWTLSACARALVVAVTLTAAGAPIVYAAAYWAERARNPKSDSGVGL